MNSCPQSLSEGGLPAILTTSVSMLPSLTNIRATRQIKLERERGRESACVREREGKCVRVCVRERDRVIESE